MLPVAMVNKLKSERTGSGSSRMEQPCLGTATGKGRKPFSARWSRLILWVVIGTFVQVGWATAGVITLRMDATASVGDQILRLDIKITNLGNEGAHLLVPSIEFEGKRIRLNTMHILAPQRSFNVQFERKQHPFQLGGRYALPVFLEYRDGSGNYYEVPQLVTVERVPVQPSGLKWTAPTINLPREDVQEIVLENQDDFEKQVHLKTLNAMNIRFGFPEEVVTIGPKQSLKWNIPIDEGLVPPGIHHHYLIASFEHDGIHHSEELRFKMHVLNEATQTSWILERQPITWSLAAALGIALLGQVIFWIRRR